MNIIKSAAALALTAALAGPAGAAMTSPEYNGIITDCEAICQGFGAANGQLVITSDIVFPDGGGVVTDTNDISNVEISISLTNGGILEFISGGSSAVNLAIDAAGNPTGGTVVFTATGAMSNLPAVAEIDVDAGTFAAIVGNLDAGGGSGSFGGAPIPVPAAVWLFGSGLAGLVSLGRRRRT